MPFRRGKVYWSRVYDARGVERQVSLGTRDRATALSLERELKRLRETRAWDVLDAVREGRLTPGRVYDEAVKDPSLRAIREELDDTDLSALIDKWVAARLDQGTRYGAEVARQVRAFAPKGRPVPRSTFGRVPLRAFLDDLPDLSGPTRNRYRAALSVLASWLVEVGAIADNPLRQVRRAKEHEPRMRFLSPAETLSVVLKGKHVAARALLGLAYGSGMELQAIQRLQRRDLDVEQMTAHAKGGKTWWRNRVVRVEPWAWVFVVEHLDQMRAAGHGGGESFLFPRIARKTAWVWHAEAIEAAGLERATLHDARHTYAVTALRRGLAPQVVAHQLGHRDAWLVFKVYGRYIVRAEDYLIPAPPRNEPEGTSTPQQSPRNEAEQAAVEDERKSMPRAGLEPARRSRAARF